MTLPPVFRGATRTLLVRLVANGAVQAAMTVATALVVRHVFDTFLRAPAAAGAAAGGHFPVLAVLALVVAAGAMTWLRVVERTDAERLGQDYVGQVRLRVFDHLARLSLRARRERGHGALMLRFVTDLNSVRQWISQGLARLTVAGIAASGALSVLAYLNPALALATALTVAASAATAHLAGRRLQVRVQETRRQRGRLATNVGDKLSALAAVQAFGQVRRERRRLKRQSRGLGDAMVGRARLAGFVRSLPDATVAFATVAILVVGAWQMAAGRATPGVLVAAIIVLGVLARPLRDLGRIFIYWHNFRVSRDKLERLIRSSVTVRQAKDAVPLAPGPGALAFEDVDVSGALSGIAAAAPPGALVVVAGPSGAGKSTVLALAARLMDPDAGRVLVDGQDVAGLDLDSLHAAIGVVSPDLPLMRGSVRRNLRYRCPGAADTEVARVLDLCGLGEALAALPGGENTRLAEGGMNLPAGLRGRIALARALLGAPRLLLLDEPEAGLDPAGRAVLSRLLAARAATTLLVTHDRDLAASADLLWFLEDGRLVEAGPADRVLAADGPAARFFRAPPPGGGRLTLVS